MTLDIRGGLKNTAINHNDYVVLEEMLSNAIDSYLIRRNDDSATPPFSAELTIGLHSANLLNDAFDVEISCHDNGSGFGDAQVKAFVTKDSTYKDYLNIKGIGKCKGAGRIQFFHHFNRLSIDSVYPTESGQGRRTLTVDASVREISENSFVDGDATGIPVGTTVTVRGRKANQDKEARLDPQQLIERFSCSAVRAHLYTALLQRLIVLKGIVGDFSIRIKSTLANSSEETFIRAADLPVANDSVQLPLVCSHGHTHDTAESLSITRYSLPANNFPEFQHEIALCANSAVVKSITRQFIKNPNARKAPINGNFELLLVEGPILESSVNQQRDGFDIPNQCEGTEGLTQTYSLAGC